MGKAIWEKQAKLACTMVSDPAPYTYDQARLPEISRRLTCGEKHPGVCCQKHADVLPIVTHACEELNVLLTQQSKWRLIGRCLCFKRDLAEEFVVIADARFARPVSQVFVRLEVSPPQVLSPRHARIRAVFKGQQLRSNGQAEIWESLCVV